MTQTVAILGASGSVGRQALDVLATMPDRFRVVGLSANSSWKALVEPIHSFTPQVVAMCEESAGALLRDMLPAGTKLLTGEDAAVRLIEEVAPEIVLVAISGAAGLPATLAALDGAKRVALANKESLVIAGELVQARVLAKNVELIPVDSEHNAVFQILQGERRQHMRRVYLTASGGPFCGYPRERLATVTPEEALTHPTWRMGEKITIDSATMMNKALEVIEAKWLFDLEHQDIKVLVHPESMVHALVEFRDGSVAAQVALPDMRIPIRYALTYPERVSGPDCALDVARMGALHFREGTAAEFPALGLAYRVLETGGTSAAVLNAANEVAVRYFLQRKIGFTEIIDVSKTVLDRHEPRPATTIEELMQADAWARKEATNWLSSIT